MSAYYTPVNGSYSLLPTTNWSIKKYDNYFPSVNNIVCQTINLPYTASTDDDDEASAEANIMIIMNSIWTERRCSKNNKKKVTQASQFDLFC